MFSSCNDIESSNNDETTDNNIIIAPPETTTHISNILPIPENALEVHSIYSSKNYLLPAEFDQSYYNETNYLDSKYYGIYVYTTVLKDKFCISNTPENSAIIYSISVNGGRFRAFSDYKGGKIVFLDETKQPNVEQIIAEERVCAMFRTDLSNVYILSRGTSKTTDSDDYRIYHCDKSEANTWRWKVIKSLPGDPLHATFSSEENKIYICSQKNLYEYNLLNNELTTYSMPEYYSAINKHSLTYYNEKLYVGSNCGLIEFDLKTKSTLWYPVYFDEFLGQ